MVSWGKKRSVCCNLDYDRKQSLCTMGPCDVGIAYHPGEEMLRGYVVEPWKRSVTTFDAAKIRHDKHFTKYSET
jgi:hypothetical protein